MTYKRTSAFCLSWGQGRPLLLEDQAFTPWKTIATFCATPQIATSGLFRSSTCRVMDTQPYGPWRRGETCKLPTCPLTPAVGPWISIEYCIWVIFCLNQPCRPLITYFPLTVTFSLSLRSKTTVRFSQGSGQLSACQLHIINVNWDESDSR